MGCAAEAPWDCAGHWLGGASDGSGACAIRPALSAPLGLSGASIRGTAQHYRPGHPCTSHADLHGGADLLWSGGLCSVSGCICRSGPSQRWTGDRQGCLPGSCQSPGRCGHRRAPCCSRTSAPYLVPAPGLGTRHGLGVALVPTILGGPGAVNAGLIVNQAIVALDFPLAMAISTIMTLTLVVLLYIGHRLFDLTKILQPIS